MFLVEFISIVKAGMLSDAGFQVSVPFLKA